MSFKLECILDSQCPHLTSCVFTKFYDSVCVHKNLLPMKDDESILYLIVSIIITISVMLRINLIPLIIPMNILLFHFDLDEAIPQAKITIFSILLISNLFDQFKNNGPKIYDSDFLVSQLPFILVFVSVGIQISLIIPLYIDAILILIGYSSVILIEYQIKHESVSDDSDRCIDRINFQEMQSYNEFQNSVNSNMDQNSSFQNNNTFQNTNQQLNLEIINSQEQKFINNKFKDIQCNYYDTIFAVLLAFIYSFLMFTRGSIISLNLGGSMLLNKQCSFKSQVIWQTSGMFFIILSLIYLRIRMGERLSLKDQFKFQLISSVVALQHGAVGFVGPNYTFIINNFDSKFINQKSISKDTNELILFIISFSVAVQYMVLVNSKTDYFIFYFGLSIVSTLIGCIIRRQVDNISSQIVNLFKKIIEFLGFILVLGVFIYFCIQTFILNSKYKSMKLNELQCDNLQ